MSALPLRLSYVGGPTVLIEFGGLRLLTDPTFDPAGSEYRTPVYALRKTQGPALSAETIGQVDAVLLSHDHHFDNLDRFGRRSLDHAARVFTTVAGAQRLGQAATGLEPWQSGEVGRTLRITATPARHEPADGDRGPVIGFVLEIVDAPNAAVYISGDSVWFDGIAAVAQRFKPAVALLFAGAARVREVGPAHLTMTAAEMVTAALALSPARIVPLHFEGWEHFSESRGDIEQAFASAGLTDRLRWLAAGSAVDLPLSD